jgi:glycosyltransferase involved in cell wall biosynthesis
VAIDVRMVDFSGIGTYVRNLIPRVVAACPDFRFHILGPIQTLRGFAWAASPNVTIIDVRSPIYSIAEQVQLVRKTPHDVSLFWSPHYNVPILHRSKLLVTVHDVFHLAMPDFVTGLHRKIYAKTLFASIRARAVQVLCVSRFTKGEMLRLAGMPEDRVKVVYNGVDEYWFRRESGPRPRPHPYLLYVGNVKPHKNLGRLVNAFRSLLDRIPHDLVIVGQIQGFITGDEETIRRAAELPDRLIFTGHLPDEELKRYYAHAEALVFPSLYEGFGLPPLEAMASGCPALVSRAASLPEVCGDAAMYFDPYDEGDIADKIMLAVQNDTVLKDLREKGRTQAARYSWDAACAETAAVLRELLDA